MADVETEELRLVITLTDNASGAVAALRKEFQSLGSGETAANTEKFKRGHTEITRMIKELGHAAEGGEKALLGLVGRLGLVGAGIAAVGTAVIAALSSLRVFSDKLQDLNNKAKLLGMHPASLKNIEEQLARVGIKADEADSAVAKFKEGVYKMGLVGSQQHIDLITRAKGHAKAMEDVIQGILHAGSTEAQLTQLMAARTQIFNARLAENGNRIDEATQFANEFMKAWQADPVLSLLSVYRETSEEDKARQDRMAAATKEYHKIVHELSEEWTHFMEDVQTSALSSDGAIVHGLEAILELTRLIHNAWNKTPESVGNIVKGGMLSAIPGIGPYLATQYAKDKLMPPHARNLLAEEAGINSIPGPPGGGEAEGGVAAHLLGDPDVSDETREGRDTLKQNTSELKRLNDLLASLSMEGQGIGMRGLGGLPGMGGGGPGGGGGGGSGSGGGGSGGGSGSGSGSGDNATPPTAPTPDEVSRALEQKHGLSMMGSPPAGDLGDKGLESQFKDSPASGTLGQDPPAAAKAAGVTGGDSPAPGAAKGGAGGEIYKKLLKEFTDNPVKQLPADAAKYGIKANTPREWATYGTTIAQQESDFKPGAEGDKGASHGIFQYGHDQVPGRNANDVNASVSAFGRDIRQAADEGSIGPSAAHPKGSIYYRRFSTAQHPDVPAKYRKHAEELADQNTVKAAPPDPDADRKTVDKTSVKSVKVDSNGSVKIDVGSNHNDATLGSTGLFRPTPIERQTQMAPAETGPKVEPPKKSESHAEEAGPG